MTTLTPDQLFALLSSPIRLRALLLLHGEGELCVCELTYALRAPQPTVSRHLAQLREAGVVQDRRAGHWIYYALHPGLPGWVRAVLKASASGTAEREPFAGDRALLAKMPNRPDAACCA